eukprot:219784-Prymnesium_polylepis.1
METQSRKNAQADCFRLILPKTKEEIPDVFIRRCDAHRCERQRPRCAGNRLSTSGRLTRAPRCCERGGRGAERPRAPAPAPRRRTATEALIVPQTPPETNTDVIKRMVAIKANTEPNVIILPKSDQEGDAEFTSRLDVAKACPNLVFPRGKSETAD